MTPLRLLLPLCVALAACQPATQATQAETPRKVRTPPLAKPQPSVPAPTERVDRRDACRVDADCKDAPQCVDADACKCVDDRCLAAKQEIEPIVDPAPNVSVQ